MIKQILQPMRSGVARLLPTGANSAVDNSQVQHMFAQKDASTLEIQPAEVPASHHVSWPDSLHLDDPSALPVAVSDSHLPAIQSASVACLPPAGWGNYYQSNALSASSFLAHQDLRFGGIPLARSFPSGQLAATCSQDTQPQVLEDVRSQCSAQLGAMPLIVGTMWMPVLCPVFGNVVGEAAVADNSDAHMQTQPGQQIFEASLDTGGTQVVGQTRRQRRAKKVSAEARKSKDALTSSEIQDLCSAVQETERQLLAKPHVVVEVPEHKAEAPSENRFIQAPKLQREPSSESSTTASVASPRISSWADAVDTEDELEIPVTAAASESELDRLLQELACTDKAKQHEAIQEVIDSAWTLAMTRDGCRAVQIALEVAPSSDKHLITQTLRGHVMEALKSPNANHVLQKCIEIMPPAEMHFVLQELSGHGTFAARHRFGCRILQRLIEHCPHEQTEALVAEVLADVAKLVRHQYGNFVIQHMLQHGSPDQVHQIAQTLQADVIRLAKHRIASHVVSCAMVHCSPEDVQGLTEVVLGEAGQLADLSRRQYGSFVVREVHRAARLHGQVQSNT
jgi:hypothetical protein